MQPDAGTTTRAEQARSLLALINAERAQMTAVSTGGPNIKSVNAEYKDRRTAIVELCALLGIGDPNPYPDLWDWYGKWSSDLPRWRDRREHLRDLFTSTEQALQNIAAGRETVPEREATGWERVDLEQSKAREALARAKTFVEFQSVGMHCRECIISLAQAVYVADRHAAAADKPPSATDAKRMLEAVIAVELGGSGNDEIRKHGRSTLDVANALTHDRSADARDAALCLEATASLCNQLAIIMRPRGSSV
jgi:hypothetical protein